MAIELHTTLCSSLQGLYRCLTDALVKFTYDGQKLSTASGVIKAKQQNPDRLGWIGLRLDSLQPRILACFVAPCKTTAPWEYFWVHAMHDLPHQFRLHVELAMDPGNLFHQADRPHIEPYLAMIGMASPLPATAPCKLQRHLVVCIHDLCTMQ